MKNLDFHGSAQGMLINPGKEYMVPMKPYLPLKKSHIHGREGTASTLKIFSVCVPPFIPKDGFTRSLFLFAVCIIKATLLFYIFSLNVHNTLKVFE